MPRSAPAPRKYEMMIVVAPTVTEDGLPTVAERVAGYVSRQGGEIELYSHENPWGHRRLAYPIQGFQDAFYVLYYFTAPPRSVDEIEREIRIDDQIIRHLIVKYDPLAESEYGRPKRPSGARDEEAEETQEATAEEETEEAVASDAEEAEEASEAEVAEEK